MPAAATFRRIAVATAATAALAGSAAPAQAEAACANANANPNDISLAASKHATLCLLNQERRSHGLKPLRDNSKLNLASQRHARDMARNNYFAHGDFVSRLRSAGYFRGRRSWSVGENIAWGSGSNATPRSIVWMWMHSPGHRANILNGSFHEIGVGLVAGAPIPRVRGAATYTTDFGG